MEVGGKNSKHTAHLNRHTALSAVGSGDIIPLAAPARVLVMLEQFAGVGCDAAVVSRLIGLTIVRQREHH